MIAVIPEKAILSGREYFMFSCRIGSVLFVSFCAANKKKIEWLETTPPVRMKSVDSGNSGVSPRHLFSYFAAAGRTWIVTGFVISCLLVKMKLLVDH